VRPHLENPITKNWAGGVAQGEGPEFKPQYQNKQTKKELKMLAIIIIMNYYCHRLCGFTILSHRFLIFKTRKPEHSSTINVGI
jgi:hypothetical protein